MSRVLCRSLARLGRGSTSYLRGSGLELRNYSFRRYHVVSCDVGKYGRDGIWTTHWRGKKRKADKNKMKMNDSAEIDLDVDEVKQRMKTAVEAFEDRLATLRLGTASPSMLDGVRVECYSTQTPLKQVAQVSVRDPNCLMVGVYDTEITNNVQKAIQGAGLNLNPILESKGRLRVPVPKASAESREKLKKIAGKEAENARIAVRNIRKDAMKIVKASKGLILDDDINRLGQAVQKSTNDFIATIDQRVKAKLTSIASDR